MATFSLLLDTNMAAVVLCELCGVLMCYTACEQQYVS